MEFVNPKTGECADLDELDRSELRKLCDILKVKWDKRSDTDSSLRDKLMKVSLPDEDEEAEDVTAMEVWNLSERAPLEEVKDGRTGEKVKRPSDCFGWLCDPKNPSCEDCPHKKPCAKLTETAPKEFLGASAKEEKPAKAVTRLPLHGKTVLSIEFTEDKLEEMDEDLQDFYKLLLKYKDNYVTASLVVKKFMSLYEVDGKADLVTELVKPLVKAGYLKVVEE